MLKGSPSKKDVIQPTLYEDAGNTGIRFLPYMSTTTNGAYHEKMFEEQEVFYTTPNKPNFQNSKYAFSQTITEPSPLNRVKEQGSFGGEFQPNLPATTVSRTTSQSFLTAIDNNPPTATEAIKYIKLSSTPQQLEVSYYNFNTLWVTQVTDEDKKITRSYTDNTGKLILERRYATNGTTILSQTYYVYDEFSRLRMMIQPEGMKLITAIPSTLDEVFIENWCFQYTYDERGRLRTKKVPGSGVVEYAYDGWDRPAVTQDANQRAKSPQEFTYVKYDILNRPILTGTFKAVNRTLTIQDVRTELAEMYNSLGAQSRYETRSLGTLPNMDYSNNRCYPRADATNSLDPLTQTFYDDYSYTDLTGFAFTPYLGYASNSATTKTRGLATAFKAKVLGSSTWILTVSYYDAFDRVIQTQQRNINGVKNIGTTEYDFQGRPVKTVEDNKLTASVGVVLQTTNTYDHMGRLTRVKHKTNNDQEIVLADYKYTDLGNRITEKNLHSTNLGTSYSQSVDYTYNIKGWLTNINRADLGNDGLLNNDANDLFGMEFKYYEGQEIDLNKKYYNGNISEVIWTNKQDNKKKAYQYTYDDLNRLTAANYRVNNGNWTSSAENNNFTLGSVTYDANGNIKTLQQNGQISGTTYGLMDNLTYTYIGNALNTVKDAVTGTTEYGYDFKNGSNPATSIDYGYDANGNLTFDDNKVLNSTVYNLLNLPQEIVISGNKKTVFTYDASGKKLRKQEYTGTTLDKTIDYIGSAEYVNGVLQFAATGEGRVYNNTGTFSYEYFIKDQTGNIRLTFAGSTATITQADDYYPFGNAITLFHPSAKNNYLFNGMEFEENSLNTYDFNARMYDPQIGRSFQPDPMADRFAYQSPYCFLGNNPVMITDPTGMFEEDSEEESGLTTGDGGNGWFLTTGGGFTGVSKGWGEPGKVYYDYVSGSYKQDGKPISTAQALKIIYPYTSTYIWSLEIKDIFLVYDGENHPAGSYGILSVELKSNSNGTEDDTGIRAPDFYSANVSITLPNPVTGVLLGWSFNATIDRHGQVFLSPYGLSLGKSSLTFGSISVTANWLLQSKKPTEKETYNFLSGHGISIGAGYIGGVNWSISPTNEGTKNAFGVGIYSPQIGISYNYTPLNFIYNKK